MNARDSLLPPNQPGLYWVRTWQDGTEYNALVSITGAAPFLAKRLVWSNQGFEHLGQLCIFAWGPRVEPPAIKEGCPMSDNAPKVGDLVTNPRGPTWTTDAYAGMQQHAEQIAKDINTNREEILRAYIAQHGFAPDETEQVMMTHPDGTVRWWIQKRNTKET